MFYYQHYEAFGGGYFNKLLNNISTLFSELTMEKFYIFALIIVIYQFIYYAFRFVLGSSEHNPVKVFFNPSNPLKDNIIVKALIAGFIYYIFLSPTPIIQMTPVVKIVNDNGEAKKELVAWIPNEYKSVIDKETKKVAHIPLILAYPLSLLEKAIFGFPDTDNFLVLDKKSSSTIDYGLNKGLYKFNENTDFDMEKCLNTDDSYYDSILAEINVDNISKQCLEKGEENIAKSVIGRNVAMAGLVLSDFFSPVKEFISIVNNRSSFAPLASIGVQDNVMNKLRAYYFTDEKVKNSIKELEDDLNKKLNTIEWQINNVKEAIKDLIGKIIYNANNYNEPELKIFALAIYNQLLNKTDNGSEVYTNYKYATVWGSGDFDKFKDSVTPSSANHTEIIRATDYYFDTAIAKSRTYIQGDKTKNTFLLNGPINGEILTSLNSFIDFATPIDNTVKTIVNNIKKVNISDINYINLKNEFSEYLNTHNELVKLENIKYRVFLMKLYYSYLEKIYKIAQQNLKNKYLSNNLDVYSFLVLGYTNNQDPDVLTKQILNIYFNPFAQLGYLGWVKDYKAGYKGIYNNYYYAMYRIYDPTSSNYDNNIVFYSSKYNLTGNTFTTLKSVKLSDFTFNSLAYTDYSRLINSEIFNNSYKELLSVVSELNSQLKVNKLVFGKEFLNVDTNITFNNVECNEAFKNYLDNLKIDKEVSKNASGSLDYVFQGFTFLNPFAFFAKDYSFGNYKDSLNYLVKFIDYIKLREILKYNNKLRINNAVANFIIKHSNLLSCNTNKEVFLNPDVKLKILKNLNDTDIKEKFQQAHDIKDEMLYLSQIIEDARTYTTSGVNVVSSVSNYVEKKLPDYINNEDIITKDGLLTPRINEEAYCIKLKKEIASTTDSEKLKVLVSSYTFKCLDKPSNSFLSIVFDIGSVVKIQEQNSNLIDTVLKLVNSIANWVNRFRNVVLFNDKFAITDFPLIINYDYISGRNNHFVNGYNSVSQSISEDISDSKVEEVYTDKRTDSFFAKLWTFIINKVVFLIGFFIVLILSLFMSFYVVMISFVGFISSFIGLFFASFIFTTAILFYIIFYDNDNFRRGSLNWMKKVYILLSVWVIITLIFYGIELYFNYIQQPFNKYIADKLLVNYITDDTASPVFFELKYIILAVAIPMLIFGGILYFVFKSTFIYISNMLVHDVGKEAYEMIKERIKKIEQIKREFK